MVATNISLNGPKEHTNKKENVVQYQKPSQQPRASELLDLKEEPTGTTLLKQHNSKRG